MASNPIPKETEHWRTYLFHPKIDSIEQKCWIIYWYSCQELECNDTYIGESARTFGERFTEHLKAPSPIHAHHTTTGHPTTLENFSIVGREGQGFARTIKESIFIRVNHPTLNKNTNRYNLPHILRILNQEPVIWCRFLILLVESCSKLVISVTEHLVEVVDKPSTTAAVFFRSEGYWNASTYMGPKMLTEHAQMHAGKCERC